MYEDITIVRGVEPDTENGGKLIDGMIIGPKLNTCRWKVGTSMDLHYTRKDAEAESKRRQLHASLFDALGLTGNKSMSASEFVKLLRKRGRLIRKILQDRKFAALIS